MKYSVLKFLICMLMVASLSSCKTTQSSKSGKDAVEIATVAFSSDARSTSTFESKTGDLKDAEESFKKELKDDAKNKQVLVNLAEIYLAQQKLSEAEQYTRRVLKLDLKNIPARKVLAKLAYLRGQYDLAATITNNIQNDLKKPDADLNNILALIEFDRGKTEVAVLMFKKMTEQFPDFVPARMNLGVLYLKNRQLQLAAKQFERVLLANPSNSDAQLHLAVVKAHRGQANEAESALRKVLRRNKNNPLALFNLAVVLKNKGDKAESTELLQAYLKNAKNTTADGDKAALAMLEEMQKDGSESEKNVNIEQLAREAQEKRTQQANNKPDQKIADDGTLVIEEAPAQVPSNRKTNNSHAPAGAKDLGNDDSISDLESQLK